MPNPSGLRDRAVALRHQVDRIADVLGPLAASAPDLHARLEPIVRSEVAKLRVRLDDVDAAGSNGWSALRVLDGETTRVAGECLALVGGVAARVAQLDRGLCRIADHLVASVAALCRVATTGVSIPAPGEYVDVFSEVIRVRYPGGGIWDLPVALHEYGHVAAGQLRVGGGRRDELSVRDILERESRRHPAYLGAFAEELFADVFATYVAGPAYAYTCLRLRFDASRPAADVLPTHPSSGRRALAILTALEHLVRRAEATSATVEVVVKALEDVRGAWVSDTEAAGSTEVMDDQAAEWSIQLATEFLFALDHSAPLACYVPPEHRWPDPPRIADDLAAQLVEEPSRAVDAGIAALDALNAAWIARRRLERQDHMERLSGIERTVLDHCVVIAGA